MAIYYLSFLSLAMPSPTPKSSAIDFLQLVAAGQVDEAFQRYVAVDFRHHNPYFAGDAASLRAGMLANAQANPGKRLQVKLALQDGELVSVFSHMRPASDAAGVALVHIFRFANGRIAELWDVGQPVPPEMVNESGMF